MREKSKETKSKKIERLRKGAEKHEIPKKFSIYHNTLHKHTFLVCINIQKLT